MKSIWEKDYINFNLSKVNKNINTPLLIIGGGVSGLMCAYFLMKENIEFILVEARSLGMGTTSGTTGQVTIAHTNIYADIKKKHGLLKAEKYLASQIDGFNLMKDIIKKENIECDYKEESTIITASSKEGLKIFNQEKPIFIKNNLAEIITSDKILKSKKALEFKNQFIVNPAKYLNGIINILLKNNIKLYDKSKVTDLIKEKDGYTATINNKYTIKTNKVIMACHYPFLVPDNLYFAKIYQSKSYTIAFKTDLKLKANYLSLDKPYYYLRTYDDNTLLIGGSDHYTGINIDIEECYNTLAAKVYKLDKHAKITHKWSREDCIVIDSLPYVGEYSKKHKNIILVTGFQKWGFTNSHVAAQNVLKILLNEKHNNLYKTSRCTLIRSPKNTCRMVLHSIDGLLISKLLLKKANIENIMIGSGKAIREGTKTILVYRESEDKFIYLENKCTHMGCSLIWNDIEKVWESKCHGSIFDPYGRVIQGPANQDLYKI